jgi:hypothetical protein
MGRVPLLLAATLAVAVTLLLYAGMRWGWPFILIALAWLFFMRRATLARGRDRRMHL